MLGPVTDAARTAPDVPGLTIAETDDTHTLHQVLNEGFLGHWGYTPLEDDVSIEVERSLPGADTSLWFLAMLLCRRLQTEGAMYVAELATLEPYRRRGIASALLALAFDRAAGEGLAQLSLHVDSENSHDAPSVYGKAGLGVRCAFDAYTRLLPR
jgi:ribosomal protein S18 acetylase RimI-like enzyme